MGQSHCELWVHLIWTTKDRKPLLVKEKRYKLIEHIRSKANLEDYHIDLVNGVEDHLHGLVAFKSTHSVSRIVNNLKGESSHWINESNLLDLDYTFRWQSGYGAFTVSPPVVEDIRKYILDQERHHKEMSFEEEIKIIKNSNN